MTPNIQELKRLAQKAEDAKDLHDAWLAQCALSDMCEVATPSTILALIEENERLTKALKPFAFLADLEAAQPDGATVMVNVSRCREARTALEGVKK